jgi:branched-chain amino acid aminotransferase
MMWKKESKFIWMDGKLVPWKESKVHVLCHALHYGTAIFEGIRCYKAAKGPAIFRLQAHTDRLFNSAKIYRMKIPYSKRKINQAILDTIRKNGHQFCYIRPLVFRGYKELGANPMKCPVNVTIATWEFGRYLGKKAIEEGIDVMVSTWNRMAPNTFPALGKASANYMSSALIKMEAFEHGYIEAIVLNSFGYVSEGSAENLFLVKDEVIYTPSLAGCILPGITRDSIITIAKDFGYCVKQTAIPRDLLYVADEAFFTGTGAEITPIKSIDDIAVGSGKRGPVTKRIQERYFGITEGEDQYNWLTYV